MRIAQRSYGEWNGRQRIVSGKNTLWVEKREFFTTYQLRGASGRILLWHDVRRPEPLPNRHPQIIYARTIPWFMWIIYDIRDLVRKYQEAREFAKWAAANKKKREAIVAYQHRISESQFIGKTRYSGRYNK